MATPITYEDFLPVSAAWISQSNLGDGAATTYSAAATRQSSSGAPRPGAGRDRPLSGTARCLDRPGDAGTRAKRFLNGDHKSDGRRSAASPDVASRAVCRRELLHLVSAGPQRSETQLRIAQFIRVAQAQQSHVAVNLFLQYLNG